MAVENTEVEQKPERGEFDVDQKPYKHGVYVEDENWVPNPYDQYGTVHTAGTAGDDVHGNVSEVSPAFQIGRTQSLVQAARALDPNDPTSADTVILPNANYRDEESARASVTDAARFQLDNPVELGMTDARRRAALTSEELETETGRHRGHTHGDQFATPQKDEKAAEGNTGWPKQNDDPNA